MLMPVDGGYPFLITWSCVPYRGWSVN